ncbi:MAG: hypothetical protein CMJ18_19755 [Phycisphaeraceae bacterium]|nr:hypothetical protein [Phycisphaeraceae bacterium]
MPIISNIGRRSVKVRMIFAAMFVFLTLGSITMIYPFLMMFSGSFKSETDSETLSIYPSFWFDDEVLYRKYLEGRYNLRVDMLEPTHQALYRSWRLIEPPATAPGPDGAVAASDADVAWRDAWRAYRDQAEWPALWFMVAQQEADRFYRYHARKFRNELSDRFDGDLGALNSYYGTGYATWQQVQLPAGDQQFTRRERALDDYEERDIQSVYLEYKLNVPRHHRVPINIDGFYWYTFLRTNYATIEKYNEAHGSSFVSYDQVFVDARAPAEPVQRDDWEQYVRRELNLTFIRIDVDQAEAYRAFLAKPEQYGDIESYNKIHGTRYAAFDEIEFPTSVPGTERTQEDWSQFIRDADACALDALEVRGPRHELVEFVEASDEWNIPDAATRPLPLADADHADMLDHLSDVRWEETRRNYVHVIDYVLLHGRAVRNTIIFCSLMILTTLLVNPLAAYALSRYKPPSQYKVLLICMATMAFPGEVTMIPAFLLLKKFPVWNLAVGGGVAALVLFLGFRYLSKRSDVLITMAAIVLGVTAGWWAAPHVASIFGYTKTHVSLLNTFKALVLPAMANGYGLFLLKGFFDSLPRELYESADIDGAGEWTKFWSLTMGLSKPILAVLALGAFTGAYSEFMMALIIIPDRDMWTLMVWMFQLQISAPQAVIHTSVIIAAIPTFIVFIFCQNIIIRGIVVPVEK